jgi:adenine-specific DNA-methyltransferase
VGRPAAARAPAKASSGRFARAHADKLRGGYYTSRELAAWLCRWAIRQPSDRVLEPSCGDGAFVLAAVRQLAQLGAAAADIRDNTKGVEIIEAEAQRARNQLDEVLGGGARDIIAGGDFFEWLAEAEPPLFDVVVGNPPFIRYQSFPEPCRSRAMALMGGLGLTPNRLTNIWVPFVAVSAAALREGGRLALVLPAELLQVSYASQLRSFLTDRFARIDVIACNELFFSGAEQEVVLLLADGALATPSARNRCRVALSESQSVQDVVSQPATVILAQASPKTIRHDSEKWLKYFLTAREIEFMRELRSSSAATPLSSHASVDVGVVTGKNAFFVLSGENARARRVFEHTIPLVSRSVQLKGARIDVAEWNALADAGDRVYLLHLAPLNGRPLGSALAAYVKSGVDDGIHQGYKCSVREPWYAVPSVWTPDAFMFRQIYDFPRVVVNRADATSTDTIHRVRCKETPELVVANTYSYLTAASAEIEGRSYGGGVLELEPTEAERLLVPARLGPSIELGECDRLIRQGRLHDVLRENDRLLLRGHLGLSASECGMLAGIWQRMAGRRSARRSA